MPILGVVDLKNVYVGFCQNEYENNGYFLRLDCTFAYFRNKFSIQIYNNLHRTRA